ncbi:MAG TPA: hypothetical protein VGG74_18085 [Kofleriaceae bacterium]|jgi:hypothetical protein
MKPTVAAFLSLSLAACYGAAPPKPPTVPLPAINAGAEIAVQSESNTSMESVPHEARTCASDGTGCVTTTYQTTEPVTRTHTTATYNEQPITYAQFNVMTDPRWDQKLAELDDLASKCQRANYPRYAGIALIGVGLVGGLIAGAAGGGANAEYALMYGGAGLGLASYALGYFAFGGRDCVEARALFNEMDMSRAMHENVVDGADVAAQMKTLADQFNATHKSDHASLDMRRGQEQ